MFLIKMTPLCLCLLAVALVAGSPSPRQPRLNRNQSQRASPLQLTVSGSNEKPDSVKISQGTKPVLEMSGESNSSTPMDPAVMKVLSRVLETLESIRDARSKELNQASRELDTLASTQKESSSGPVDLSGTELKKTKPIIKKTYGYKVTVYATPLNDTKDDTDTAASELQPISTDNHGIIHAYGNPPVGYQGDGRVESSNRGGAVNRGNAGRHHQDRKELEDKGYSRGQRNNAENIDHKENEKFYHNQGAHQREAQDSGHNRGEFGHDRGAANEKGLKEKTQIEYFERERGQEEEEIKKAGKEAEGHQGQNINHGAGGQGPHYYGHVPVASPGVHYVQTPFVHGQHGHVQHAHGQHSGNAGHRANQHDLHKRRKNEGLKERGFKITVEREVYLRDGFHDKGFGRHDKGHHKELSEKGHHKINQGDSHKHLTKEVKKHEDFDKGYGVRKHEASSGKEGESHLVDSHQSGHLGKSTPIRSGITYVVGEGDQHYSPSNEKGQASLTRNESTSAPRPDKLSLKDEYNRAKVVPTIQESELQKYPGLRNQASPKRVPKVDDQEDDDPEDLPPPSRPRRPSAPIREETAKPRSYLPRVKPPASRNQSGQYNNGFLDSITPPTEDRFAFNVPKKESIGNSNVRFPTKEEQQRDAQQIPVINLYIPPGSDSTRDHEQTHYDLQTYPHSNEVPRPENPDIQLIRRHRVFVPKELGSYHKLGFSQQVLGQGQQIKGPVNQVLPGVWYAPSDKK